MPLTAGQTSAFFEAPDQMGIQNATVVQLQQEGIDSVDSLADFDKTTIEQIAANLRHPAGRVPNNNPGMPPGSTIAKFPLQSRGTWKNTWPCQGRGERDGAMDFEGER
jgi:predicted RecB family nuclease